jgi:Zn-dependent protease
VLGVSRVFLALVAAMVLAGVLLWLDVVPALGAPLSLVFVLLAWVVSVCVHEFFHAVVAFLGGDRDVAASGYLTLNPLRYTSVVMSIVFPVIALLLGGIGFPGGAVYINHAMLRSRTWDSLVSLAGPVANALFALVCAGLIAAAPMLVAAGASFKFIEAVAFLGYLEVFAVVLNLVPVPPLDGFGILRPWLPWSIQSAAARIGTAGYVLVFLLMFYVPPVGGAVVEAVSRLAALIGIDPILVALGSQNVRFR